MDETQLIGLIQEHEFMKELGEGGVISDKIYFCDSRARLRI